MARTWTVAAYLARRMQQAGVGHVFGVPGDFCLPFFDAMVTVGPEVVVTCNELNAGYAADGYARLNGIGALAVTWNVGGFSVLNAVAGAAAEGVPVVAVCGAAPLAKRRGGVLHHSVGDRNAQAAAFRRVVPNSVRLHDPAQAPALIDRALETTLRERRPAFLELPLDVSRALCATPGALAPAAGPRSDAAALDAAVAHVAALLAAAGEAVPRVAVLAGVEIARFGLAADVVGLAEHLGAPYVTTVHAKAVLPETHPLFAGVAIGALGEAGPRDTLEHAGVVLGLGSLLNDLDMGLDTLRLDRRRLVAAVGDTVRVGRRLYPDVALKDFVAGLRAALPRGAAGADAPAPGPAAPAPVRRGAPLTTRRFFELARGAVAAHSVVLTDVGDAMLSVAGMPMPPGATVLSQAFYASIGWCLPATVGASFAAPARRPLAFIGDGAFQMSGQEFSTLVRHRRSAAVFVLDNGGYLMERCMHEGPFNDVQPWRYAELPRVFGGGDGLVVETEGQLEQALAHLRGHPDEPVLVQVRLGATDASDTLRRFGEVVRRAPGPEGVHG
jgi:TPP-dependent 2-oxoacid decarboxylase